MVSDVEALRLERVSGSGFRVQGSGFRVQGLGFRVQGLETLRLEHVGRVARARARADVG
jgi:hypothetical protein